MVVCSFSTVRDVKNMYNIKPHNDFDRTLCVGTGKIIVATAIIIILLANARKRFDYTPTTHSRNTAVLEIYYLINFG